MPKKITACQAKRRLIQHGIDFSEDFHALRSSQVRTILDVAKQAKYRKSPSASGSKARMFFYYLARKRGC